MPSISVIVPVFKVEKYLSACIESILRQSFEDFELILVDDGSPDRSGEICEEYAEKDKRITVIHQENQGLSGARNSGMDVAMGEYVTFIDSDDVVSEEYLTILYSAIQEKNADMAVCLCHDCFDGIIPNALEAPNQSQIQYLVVDGKTATERLYKGDDRILIGSTCKLYLRAALSSLRFPVGRLHEDQAFTPRAYYQSAKIVFSDAKLYYYRVRSDSITHQVFTQRRYDDLWAIEGCIRFFEEQGEKEIVAAARDKRQRLICTYAIYAKRDGVEVPESFQISIPRALAYLRKNVSRDKYSYYLTQVNEKWVIWDTYLRKIEKLFRKT